MNEVDQITPEAAIVPARARWGNQRNINSAGRQATDTIDHTDAGLKGSLNRAHAL